MLIIQDATGLTIKRTIQSANHVRVGIFQTALWVDGIRRGVREIEKPHVEFDCNDCNDLLRELGYMEKGI